MTAPEAPAQRVLVVEDDVNLAAVIMATLASAELHTHLARTGADALACVATFHPDLVLLDAGLPDLDGFEVLTRLRAAGEQVPVLFLTARRTVNDRVRGLDGGAFDYIVKPFHFDELLARIRVALQFASRPAVTRWVVGDLVVDDAAHRVSRAGVDIHLSPTEYTLLRCFARHGGTVVTRAQIYDEVWEYDFGSGSAIIDSFVSRLRRKIEPDGVRLLETVRGVGYRLGPGR